MTKCTCTYIQAVQKVEFVMRWRCITDICGLKLNEICHHQMRFMGSSTSKIHSNKNVGFYIDQWNYYSFYCKRIGQ